MNYMLVKDLQIPVITTSQMREVDRLAVEEYGIQIIQMMENAGRNLAELVRRMLGNSVLKRSVAVAVGKGNNGGGGLVAARHLYNWGAEVSILTPYEPLSGISEIQMKIIENLPVVKKTGEAALRYVSEWKSDVILDALIGYGLSGELYGWISKMIEAINTCAYTAKVPVVALDIPSGLDATIGKIHDPCIQASATMTLALPKTGLVNVETRKVVGTLYLADIGIPAILYKEMGIKIESIFIHDTIVRLTNLQGADN